MALLRDAAALLAASERGSLSKCAGLWIIGARGRGGDGSGLLPWRVHEFRKILPFTQFLPPLWSWQDTDAEGRWRGMGAFASFLAQRREDERGKFLRNRPARLRWPRRSRPPWPSGAPGAGTARSDPGRAGAASFRPGARFDGLFVEAPASPTPQLRRGAGAGLRGRSGRRKRIGSGSGLGIAGTHLET